MLYKIVELSTVEGSDLTYALVHFWRTKADHDAGKPWARRESFGMQLTPIGVSIVINAKGWPKRKSDGVFINPMTIEPGKEPEWEREPYNRDLLTEIKANIEAYWLRAEVKDYPADHADPRIQRDDSDPHGVLARTDVRALRGVVMEKLWPR